LYHSDSAKNVKKKAGAPKLNLMHNVLVCEIFCNFWRLIYTFGEGFNVLNRGLSVYTFTVSFSLPVIVLFGNALSVLNAWIAMTRMNNITPDELNARLAKYHFGI
jgi:hypothetical protein